MFRIGNNSPVILDSAYCYIIWYVVSEKDYLLEDKELNDLLSIITNNSIQDIQNQEKIFVSTSYSSSISIDKLSDNLLMENYRNSLEIHKKKKQKIANPQSKLLKLLKSKIHERGSQVDSSCNLSEEYKQKNAQPHYDLKQIECQQIKTDTPNEIEQNEKNRLLLKTVEDYLECIGLSFEDFQLYNNNEFFFKKNEVTYVLKLAKQVIEPEQTTLTNELGSNKENILFSVILVFSACNKFNVSQQREFQSSLYNIIHDTRQNISFLRSHVKTFLPIFERYASAIEATLDYSLENILRVILLILQEDKCESYKMFLLETKINSMTSQLLFLNYSSPNYSIEKNYIIECFTIFLKNSKEYSQNIHGMLYVKQIPSISKFGKYILLICKTPHSLYYENDLKFIREKGLNIKLVCILAGDLISNPKFYTYSKTDQLVIVERDRTASFQGYQIIEKVHLFVYENLQSQ
ncbi:hypothetical protein SteCoe_37566 [Stentor coeruleus]|uniref:Uncharacterized protein n=1 Tax=Stentor coeruleus TaxID=5963 RepID=A0A1R2AMS7_9CILI|nr:hypothetical protein SteCoe_37566 [Stentor coeruleus]